MPEYAQLEGGNVPVYTGPKGGKFVVKNGHKVYLDRKTLNDTVKYTKKTTPKKKSS